MNYLPIKNSFTQQENKEERKDMYFFRGEKRRKGLSEWESKTIKKIQPKFSSHSDKEGEGKEEGRGWKNVDKSRWGGGWWRSRVMKRRRESICSQSYRLARDKPTSLSPLVFSVVKSLIGRAVAFIYGICVLILIMDLLKIFIHYLFLAPCVMWLKPGLFFPDRSWSVSLGWWRVPDQTNWMPYRVAWSWSELGPYPWLAV